MRLLAITAVVAFVAGASPIGRSGGEVFEEITVERINVVEPDGTPRLVLSNEARFPGLILNGKEYPHPNRTTAGMLFFNDEGTEQGGLIFGGETDAEGNVSAYGHLSFDQYEQDQVITMSASEGGSRRRAGFSVWDRPDYPTREVVELIQRTPEDQRDAALREFLAGKEEPQPRMYIGKSQNGAVSVRLNDPEGRERLIIEVTAEGVPVLRFLDENGTEVARFPEVETGD